MRYNQTPPATVRRVLGMLKVNRPRSEIVRNCDVSRTTAWRIGTGQHAPVASKTAGAA